MRAISRRIFANAAAAALTVSVSMSTATAFELDPDGTFANRVIAITDPVAAPDSVITMANGRTATLDDWNGKVRLVTMWATWCHVCDVEMPIIAKLTNVFDADEVAFLPVSVDEEPAVDKVARHLERHDLTVFPVMIDRHRGMAARIGLRGTPTTLVVDKFGQAVGAFEGQAPWTDPQTHAWLTALVAAETPEASRGLLSQ